MIRIQVYLPKTLYKEVELVAMQEKKARARVIRELLKEGLTNKKPKETIGQALGKLIEIGKKYTSKNAPTDLSVNHDKYLYEED